MFRSLTRSQRVVDVLVASAFFVISYPINSILANRWIWSDFGFATADAAGLVVGLLFSSALAVRRMSSALALAVAWLAALVQMGFGLRPSFSDLAIFAVLYATAAYGSRPVFWAGFTSALLGALVITVYLLAGALFPGGELSLQSLPVALVILVAAAFALGLSWTIGALVRSAKRAQENRAAQQRAEAETVAEQERVRIARDMHDVVAHSLAVVIAQADGARYAVAGSRGTAPVVTQASSGADDPAAPTADPRTEALETIAVTARAALADVRLLLAQLRYRQGDGPQPRIADLDEVYAQVRAAGVALRVDVDPAPLGEPPTAVQLAVYRILQEALTNAMRHGAPGGPVEVSLAWRVGGVELEVRNPVSPEQSSTRVGHGLIGMRERAQLAGGRLDAAAANGAYIVRAQLPIGART